MNSDLVKNIDKTIKELAASGESKKEIPGHKNLFVFSDIGEAINHQLIATKKFKGKVFVIVKKL